ncbi:hypothetical protein [Fodinibius halophilus]|uniref:MFS transporter n=1 Tax=Fodinibius halophilus TaxID=1736908 RepID=A0A6M1T582_9BACT|nr:hypothetical protein [Fodinibius halophilus]NGP87111.1 hypothetical protein [Fodinibius halophilus]
MNKDLLKSIGTVIAGILITVIFSNGTDFVLEWLGVFPAIGQAEFDAWMFILAIIYRTIYSATAGYLVAALAPNRPMRHVIILGIIGTIAATLGVLASISKGFVVWYPIVLAVLAFPSVWVGGKMNVTAKQSLTPEEVT